MTRLSLSMMKNFARCVLPGMAVSSLWAAVASAAPLPALFTQQQAKIGHMTFETHCSMCHGKKLQGISAPTLVGQDFASAGNNYTVAAIFGELSQQMPAGDPGSLSHKDYTDIMAFILNKNGYPAGKTPLTYSGAQSSTAKLISQVK